jgi:hypothetical protein
MKAPASFVPFLGLLLVLAACTRTTNEYNTYGCAQPLAGDTADARAAVGRLEQELAYARFRLEECVGRVDSLLLPTGPGRIGGLRTGADAAARAGGVSPKAPVQPLDHIVAEPDDQGVYWYFDGRLPRGLDSTMFYLYIGKRASGGAWLRMRAQYSGARWLYLKALRIEAGHRAFERRIDPALVFGAAGEHTVAEWTDQPPSDADLRIIRDVVAASEARIVFIGHKGEHSRPITDLERKAFVNMLEQYDRLGRTERGEAL